MRTATVLSKLNEHCSYNITKTYLYNFDPLKPYFHIVKLGFTGVYIIFLFLLKNLDCGYSSEPPRRGGSDEYPQSMFWAEIWKISEFLYENLPFLEVKFSIYLNRRVSVMRSTVHFPICSSESKWFSCHDSECFVSWSVTTVMHQMLVTYVFVMINDLSAIRLKCTCFARYLSNCNIPD